MAILDFLSALLLASGVAQALIIPESQHQHQARANNVAINSEVKVILSSFATLEQLAKELTVDISCLRAANPLLSALKRGQYCTVPHACCGTSCEGKFCSKRPQCQGQSTTPAPVQNGPSTTCVSTITTSISASSTPVAPSQYPVPSSVSSTVLVSSESNILSSAGGTLPGPIGGGSSTGDGLPFTTNSLGQTIISGSSGPVALPTAIPSGIVVTLPGGSVTTAQPSSVPAGSLSGSGTTDNPVGPSTTSSDSAGITVSSGLPSMNPIPAPGESSVTTQPSGSSPSTLPPSGLPQSGVPSSGTPLSGAPPSGTPQSGLFPSGSPSSGPPPSGTPSSSPGLVTTTDSLGQTIVEPTGGSATGTAPLPPDDSATAQPSAVSSSSIIPGLITTTNSLGQTIISGSSGVTTLSNGAPATATQTLPNGSIITFVPSATAGLSSSPGSGQPPSSSSTPSVVTTTNEAGETLISTVVGEPSSGVLPSPSSSPSVVTTTNSDGETVASTLAGVIPSATAGLPSPPSGQPSSPPSSPSVITTTNSAGETIASTLVGVVPSATVGIPSPSSGQLPSPSSSLSVITSTNSAGETITSTLIDVPTSIASLTTITNTDGSVVVSTFSSLSASQQPSASDSISTTAPPVAPSTILGPGQSFNISSTLSPSSVIIDSSGGTITSTSTTSTSPSTTPDLTSDGMTTGPEATTAPGPTTSPPTDTSSSSTALAGVFPVTTSVPEPKATDDGTEIPCSLWFFKICISWLDTSILGWKINLPPGIYPPGPPPGITFPPGIQISVSGTIPDWPTLTIGPDRLPTYEPEPEECKTESAELCLTSTSFGVSSVGGTVTTTASDVLSTCATVYGCEVSDSSTSTASTSTASDYPYSCTFGCEACNGNARRDVSPPTALPTIPKPQSLISFHDIALARRDIPNRLEADGSVDFYDTVKASSNTVNVEHDQRLVMQTTSKFIPFDASERNIRVEGLRGCTSILVVSRLGAYISHIWEPTFTAGNFQVEGLDYLRNGRVGGGETGTEPLGSLVQRGVFSDSATTKIFIMTPATYDLDLNDGSIEGKPAVPEREQRASLLTSVDPPLFDGNTPGGPPDRLTPMKAALSALMPGVPISQFNYRRQVDDAKVRGQAYGKATIVYSNRQITDPADPYSDKDWTPTTIAGSDGGSCEIRRQKAVWQCYIQDYLMGSDLWDALPAQIAINQKRQAGDCGSPSSTPAPTSEPTSASAPATTPPPLTDLPDLTTTAFSTPSGSSCASTTTFSQCNGSGGGAACVTTSSCASFVATDTPTPTSTEPTSTTYEAPLFTSPTVCNNEADFPGHADVASGAQEKLAQDFCGSHNVEAYPGRGPPLAETLQDGDDINYFYSISWKDIDCRPEGTDHQNTYMPQGNGITCPIVMRAIYRNCNNGGVGGYMDVGCLRYRFDGAI
ncbi:unnamed protein product [Zymoseptoria tritici ST99CH_1A5]|uniref:LysM domain-containing protein n=1 Tax=Zymoseptoria tritici ST99CH_1A5 TaxID=1276529 RepID=A0A1Y6LI80_ZYMTR|nr:unnamed protein product [Zymoseptoria tritici ST99CH_1A5]